jgi:hypothetical protein
MNFNLRVVEIFFFKSNDINSFLVPLCTLTSTDAAALPWIVDGATSVRSSASGISDHSIALLNRLSGFPSVTRKVSRQPD